MAIRIQCPNCGASRNANERVLGREINCPDCSKSFVVPTLEEIEAAKAEAAKQQLEKQAQTVPVEVAVPTVDAVSAEPELSEEEKLAQEEREVAAAATSFRKPKAASGEDMDMTPMVDVTFLLLIFFMITASFSVQKSIQRPAQKPDDPSLNTVQIEDDENPDIVTVQVDEFNAYNVITTDWDRVCGSKQDLIVALKDAHAGGSGGKQPSKLVVQAHEDCIHSSVVAALDAGREAQFENFEVSTVEQFD